MKKDIYLPHEAVIIDRIEETPTIVTFRLQFTDKQIQNNFQFTPGQFNMLYLFGIGEIPVNISSDPENRITYDHTIRVVGRVTKALIELKEGDRIGVRGPFGRGWPLKTAENKDLIIVTGGLCCAPSISIIHYVMKRRNQFGALKILQGIKHSDDFVYHEHYAKWRQIPNTEVYISADQASSRWPWMIGRVTQMIASLKIKSSNSIVMMCGPETMMQVAAKELIKIGVLEKNLYLSMERNMECAVGHCGHCQFGGSFICKDGPVFSYPEIKMLLREPGF